MLFINAATTLHAPLLGLLAMFAAASPDPASAVRAPVSAVAAELLQWEEDFARGGGLHGINEEFDAGQACSDATRTRYEAAIVAGAANCKVVGWVSEDPNDCRVRVHIDLPAFHWAICRVQVYGEQ